MAYFELINEEKNNYKFWEIQQYKNENSIIVRYGKIGNNGVTKEFNFPKNAKGIQKREKEYRKLIDSKVKKGYVQKLVPGSFFYRKKKLKTMKVKYDEKVKAKAKKNSVKKTCPAGKMINPNMGDA